MKSFQRGAGFMLVLALLTSARLLTAQDDTKITVVGSGIVTPVLQSLATASGVTVNLNVSVTGTNSGFEQFCQGQADVTTAARTITAAEDTQCTQNNVKYTELLVGHDVIVFVAKPDAAYIACLSTANMSTIFPPSAQGAINNWQQVSPENPNVPLTVFVPPANDPSFAVLDNLIPGDGIRTDATTPTDEAAIIAAVSADAGAIGVVNLNTATAAGDQVKILQLNTNDAAGCTTPLTDNVESGAYTAADDFYVYVNKGRLTKTGLKDALSFASSDQAAGVIEGLGFSAPSAAAYSKNQSSLEGTGDTRPFSGSTTSYQIPLDVAGTVEVAGATSGRTYLSNAGAAFNATYQQVTVNVKTLGQPAGIRRLCNGEIDIAIIDSDLTAEQSQNCDANNIKSLEINLGKEAVVLVGNAANTQLACLTYDQLKKTWEAASSKTVTNWNQVDSTFPDQPMTLFTPDTGDSNTDLLLIKAAQTDIPVRDDTQVNDDALYRAAATANVEGGLTYMSWSEYQTVLANNQERIQLVSVNGGNGCIAPSDATIADGTYPLTRAAKLLVNTKSLTKPPVQSFLWYLAEDGNYGQLQTAGLIGVSFGDFPTLRETLQKSYLDAQIAAAEATPEPEATAEGTPEATPAS